MRIAALSMVLALMVARHQDEMLGWKDQHKLAGNSQLQEHH